MIDLYVSLGTVRTWLHILPHFQVMKLTMFDSLHKDLQEFCFVPNGSKMTNSYEERCIQYNSGQYNFLDF
jgi:hypothetical protein